MRVTLSASMPTANPQQLIKPQYDNLTNLPHTKQAYQSILLIRLFCISLFLTIEVGIQTGSHELI